MSAATNQEGAREAPNRSLSTLEDGDMRAAAAWASIAADTSLIENAEQARADRIGWAA